ncbi:MAG: cupin domain-containing protein [Desulfobacterales bacterium]
MGTEIVKTRFTEIPAYITKDGSLIRELMHPNLHACHNQSLAEAEIPPGSLTRLHRHVHTEELYHILTGNGLMHLGDERFAVESGDTVCIRPGTPHQIRNTGETSLKILCCCCPPYSHEDTQLL